MSLKKFELEKLKGSKVSSHLANATRPDRFGLGAAAVPDRREQRKLDQAAGLVPFACKLPADLVQKLQEGAASHEGGLNALVAETLLKGL